MKLGGVFRHMPARQRKTGRTLIGFFVLMLAFTVLSRGLDSFSVARVAVTAPVSGFLTHRITVEGNIDSLRETAVALPEGFLVRQLPIREGSRVAVGDVLAVLDLSSVEDQLEVARRELEEARLTTAAQNVKAEMEGRDVVAEAELALERAKEDAVIAEETGREAIAWAERDLRQAQDERRRLRDEDYEDSELESVQKEILAYSRALEEAIREAEVAQIQAERTVENAQLALAEAERGKEEGERKEAAEQEAKDIENRRDGLGLQAKQERVAELEALLAAEGKIIAEQSGLLTAWNLKTGDMTSAGGAFLLAEQEGDCVFTGTATKKDAERLSPGDKAEITVIGIAEPVSVKIAAVNPPEEKGGEYTIQAELPDMGLRPGTAGTLTVTKKSADNTILLPLSTLHSGGGERSGYVYVLRERSTTMGLQTMVERIAVEVLDRGETSAAVRASFAPDDQVVSASSRALANGDRVRLVKEGEA